MRYTLPKVTGKGSGLGNQIITWSRAFLAAQVLNAKTLKPAFGRNARPYWKHFNTPKYDWLLQKCLISTLPVIEFGEQDYLKFGGGDVVNALTLFAEANHLYDRNHYILTTSGMWGGYYHIQQARDFIFSTLYNSNFAPRNLLKLAQRLSPSKLTVGMHIRLGDFNQATDTIEDYRGRFNIALPLSWYINIATSIQAQFGDAVEFLIASDGSSEQLKPLTDHFNCILTNDVEDADCSDILALSKTDLLVCSVSSFSAIAAFLSDVPYLWFEPQLQAHPEGLYSIWGHEESQQQANSPTINAIKASQSNKFDLSIQKGWAVDMTGKVPSQVFDQINRTSKVNDHNILNDLLMYGVVTQNSAIGP